MINSPMPILHCLSLFPSMNYGSFWLERDVLSIDFDFQSCRWFVNLSYVHCFWKDHSWVCVLCIVALSHPSHVMITWIVICKCSDMEEVWVQQKLHWRVTHEWDSVPFSVAFFPLLFYFSLSWFLYQTRCLLSKRVEKIRSEWTPYLLVIEPYLFFLVEFNTSRPQLRLFLTGLQLQWVNLANCSLGSSLFWVATITIFFGNPQVHLEAVQQKQLDSSIWW